MKITVISYDFWGYDGYIEEALRRNSVAVQHIRLSAYRHPDFLARVKNAFSKLLYQKNLKDLQRQRLVLDKLKNLGMQDQILVINPDYFPPELHAEIRKHTHRYLAFLYDSVAANPVDKVLPYFDEVFSFDKEDCERLGFTEITNYIYLQKWSEHRPPTLDLVYIGSCDERVKRLYHIAEKLENLNKKYEFRIVGKRTWKYRLMRQKGFIFSGNRILHKELPEFYKQSAAILDLVRSGQSGLSFRFFEAMALGKKIVTDNATVKEYDFYNPLNIWILNDNLLPEFFESPYVPIPPEIYEKYTVDSWVKKVFRLP